MADKDDDKENQKYLESSWAKSANRSLKHKQQDGYAITNTSRAGMALKSVPLEIADRKATGEGANPYSGSQTAMQRRMKSYNEAADAAEKKKPLPKDWTDKYGSP